MEDLQSTQKSINVYEVVQQLRVVQRYVLKRWWILLIFSLGLALYMGYRENSQTTIYEAVNTFLLEDEIMEELGGGNGGSSLLSILQGQNVAVGSKLVLVELALSYHLIEKTLLRSCMIDKKWQSLGKHYLEITGRMKSITGNPAFKNFNPDSTYKFGVNADHDYLMRSLAKEIAPNITATKKESGIIKYSIKFWQEEFTRIFSINHIKEISGFYTEKRLEKASQLLKYTSKKMDSLEMRLKGQEYGLAQLNDEGFGVVMTRAMVPELNYKRNINILSSQYVEAVTANNLARLEYEKRRPVITIIDDARSPLSSESGNLIQGIVIGLFAGLILGIAVLVGVFYLNRYWTDQKKSYLMQGSEE